MPRRITSRRVPTRKRKLVWARTFQSAILDPEGVNTDNAFRAFPLERFETEYESQLLGSTIRAVRGVITATLVEPAGSQTVEAFGSARFAMRVFDAVPIDPEYTYDTLYDEQAHADWFFFEPFCLHNSGIISSLEEAEATSGSEIRHINNRSQRKLEELGQTIELVISVPPTGSSHNNCFIHFFWDLSFLIALP